jgi:hypothetical protein
MLKMSLSAWSHPSRGMVRRVIALGMAVSFLFPAMSWAFQVQAYDTDPGTAAAPEITPDLGKVISSSRGTLGATLYLIQDLHCNVEVQTNIRRILGQLKKKNPDLKLLAVEGATGIIPTRSLASLPNTPAKRAVAAYFMREGKLSGADVLAICDQPQVELFGAENRVLYAQSLALIQEFVTESNRGLLFELMDRIKFMQARQYGAQLLAFEKRREAMLAGRLDVRDYHGALVRQALQMNVPLGMEKFNGSGGGWDLYERTLLDRVLEAKIRARLLKTAEEKRLSAYYLYVEAAEHILSVSASQAEVSAFKAASATLSLTAVQKTLQAEFRKMDYYAGVDPAFGDEVAALEKNMQKGLQFYQLAQQRNDALFEKATARLRARGERKAALVAGGFHTEGIAQLARAQGYSVVVIRPRQVNPDATNNYFLRLRYPDQPTELERLLASYNAPAGAAIAVPLELRKASFQQAFQEAVAKMTQAWSALKAGRVTTADQATMESRPDGVLKLRLPRGVVFYLTFVKGELFVDRNMEKVLQFRQAAGLNSLPADNTVRGTLRLPVVRILGMAALGVALAVVVVQVVAGLAVAPMVLVGALGILVLGMWSLASAPAWTLTRLVTRRNVLLGSLLLGTLTFSALLGSLMSSVVVKLSAVSADPTNAAAHVVGWGLKALSFMGLVPYHHDPAVAGTAALNTLGMTANVLVGSLFSGPIRLAGAFTRVLMLKNSRKVLGVPFAQAAAKAIADELVAREIKQNGILYNENEARPAKGAFVITGEDEVGEVLGMLRALGLKKFEDSTPVDFFIKPTVLIDQDHITPATVESDLVFQSPQDREGRVQLIARVMVMDPMFIDEKGRNLNLTQLPAKYVEAVLNALNPAAIYSAFGSKQLTDLFARAGKFEGTFKSQFIAAVKKWQTMSSPKDLKTMQLWIKMLLIHEFTHALALNLPDVIPTNLPQNEQDRLNRFSVTAYINLVNSSEELHGSVVYVKNLIKALQAVEGQPVDAATQNRVVRVLALEMFCDRFSMYMFEVSRKLQAYTEIMPDMGEITVDTMRRLEKQRLSNPSGFQSINELTEAEMTTLAARLKAAETEHVYVSSFRDPVISQAERGIFEPFLDLLRHFDSEKTIDLFTVEHSTGDFFKASQNGNFMSENKASLEHVVQKTEDLSGVEGPAGLAVAVGEKLVELTGLASPAVIDSEDRDPVVVPAANLSSPAGKAAEDDWLKQTPAAEPVAMALDQAAETPQSVLERNHLPVTTQRGGMAQPLVATLESTDDWLSGAVETAPIDLALEAETAPDNELTAEEEAQQALLRRGQNQVVAISRVNVQKADEETDDLGSPKSAAKTIARTLANDQKGSIAGAMLMQSPQTIAPVTQPATSPQISTANQGLAASRAAQLLPGLFDLWNTQPGPPPHTPGVPFWVVTNDPALAVALVGMLQGPPMAGITPPEWDGFARSIQVQIIDPALGERGGGTGVPGSSFAASDLGKLSPKDAYQKLLNATPAGIPRAGSVNGLVVVTPSATGPAEFNAAVKGAINPETGLPFGETGSPAGTRNLNVGEGSTGPTGGVSTAGENMAAIQTRLNGAPGTTGMVYPNASGEVGRIGIPLQVVGVPLNQLLPGSVPQDILNRSNALKSALVNGAEFGDMLLLTRDQVMSAEVQGLLGNYDQGSNLVQVQVDANAAGLLQTQLGAQGYQQVLALRKLIEAQAAQLKKAFAAGVKAVPVALDTLSADTMKKLAASLAAGNLAVFGSSASSLISKMAAFPGLSEIARTTGLATEHAGNSRMLAETTAPDSFLTEGLDLLEEAGAGRLNEVSSDAVRLSALAGHPMTAAQAAEFTDLLKLQDQVLYLSKNRSHGEAVEVKTVLTSSLALVELVDKAKGTRNAERLFAGAEPIPETAETKFLKAQPGLERTFSMLALGVAATRLIWRTLFGKDSLLKAKGFKAQRLDPIAVMTHPSFIRALRLMARIITGNYGTREIQDPLLRQQLADLTKLESQLAAENKLGGEKKTLVDLVGSPQVPASLRYALTHLAWLRPRLQWLNTVFKINLEDLNPEMLMLVNEFLSMEGVTWYFAKQTYMLQQIAAHEKVMDPLLWKFLMLTPQAVQAEREQRNRERLELRTLANPTAAQAERLKQLTVESRDLLFVKHFQDQLARMDKDNNPRLVKSLIWTLLGQLSRKDIAAQDADRYTDSILTIISLIDPDNRVAVQMTEVREGEVKTLVFNLPLILKNSPIHLESFMRYFPLLYDEKGRQIMAPERNRIISALQAA